MSNKTENIYPPAAPILCAPPESKFSIAGLFIGAAVGAAYAVTTESNKTDALVNIGIGALGGYGLGLAVDQLSPEAQERIVSETVKKAFEEPRLFLTQPEDDLLLLNMRDLETAAIC